MTDVTNMDIKVKGIYKHYKGDYYIVEDIALDSDNLQKLVIYRGLYENSPLLVRPYTEFISTIDEKSNKKRFELQDIKSVRK